jgi:hypothetical protein
MNRLLSGLSCALSATLLFSFAPSPAVAADGGDFTVPAGFKPVGPVKAAQSYPTIPAGYTKVEYKTPWGQMSADEKSTAVQQAIDWCKSTYATCYMTGKYQSGVISKQYQSLPDKHCGAGVVDKTLTETHTTTLTTDWNLTAAAKTSLLGIAEVTLQAAHGESWTETDTVTATRLVRMQPGSTAWIEEQIPVTYFTGKIVAVSDSPAFKEYWEVPLDRGMTVPVNTGNGSTFQFGGFTTKSDEMTIAQIESECGSGTWAYDHRYQIGSDAPRELVNGTGSDRCLDATDHSTNGTRPVLWTCNGQWWQKWSKNADNTIRINGKCLEAFGGGTQYGTPVALWDCNGGTNQKWLIVDDGRLVNSRSGTCLTPVGNASGNGTQLELQRCSKTEFAQRWIWPTPN